MKNILMAFMLLCVYAAGAQKEAGNISKGNDYYNMGQFDLAEKAYRAALKKEPASTIAAYNLANALYSQKRYPEAIGVLKSIKSPENSTLQAAIHYNTGVAHTKERDLEASIEAYKAALRLTPDDKDARENLQKALMELKKEKQQQQKKQQSSMSQSEAQRQLEQLQEKEKEIQERMNRNRSRQGSGMQKDW